MYKSFKTKKIFVSLANSWYINNKIMVSLTDIFGFDHLMMTEWLFIMVYTHFSGLLGLA